MGMALLLLVSVLLIIYSTAWLKFHPFLALLFAAFVYGILSGMPLQQVVDSINQGFGGTIGGIGIVILFGTIIGIFLERSGGAYTMAESILKITGRGNVPLAMSLIGYLVSIPVFCDSGFVILSPLNKALAKKSHITLASCAIALGLGLYATHTMVPPTPGPIAAAGILKADLGLVILFGMITALIALIPSWLFATRVAARVAIDPEPDLTEAELESKMREAPSAALSFLPLLVPILLIVLNSIAAYPTHPFGEGRLKTFLLFAGTPLVALLIGVLIAFLLPRRWDQSMFSTTGWVGEAVVNAAIIITITGAGGSFGKVLQNSGIADVVGKPLADLHLGIWIPFLMAAAIKTAQGSSTVAIITTASLSAPLLASLGVITPAQTALTVVMIGAGSMVVSHANDSYFWVVTQFSKMDVATGYRLHSVGTILEGLTAGIAAWLLFTIVT
ncbi:MAG TPA: GntP family permease [bacterium]|nr:GntP family permease [bacterium]